jgi:hypothetical protein
MTGGAGECLEGQQSEGGISRSILRHLRISDPDIFFSSRLSADRSSERQASATTGKRSKGANFVRARALKAAPYPARFSAGLRMRRFIPLSGFCAVFKQKSVRRLGIPSLLRRE